MEIIQINKNKIQINLYEKDLQRYNLDFTSFMATKNIESLHLFSDIINFIYENNLISITKNPINFNLFFINNSEIIINIFIAKNFSFNNFFVYYSSGNIVIEKLNSLIYEFNNFNNLIDFFNSIKLIDSFYDNIFIYEYSNNFYLILNNIFLFSNFINNIILQLSEFSNNIYFSDIFINKIKEYGINIFNPNNINKINIFKK